MSLKPVLAVATLLAWILSAVSSGTESPLASTDPIFREVAGEVGLDFNHFNGATGRFFLPEIMGAGAGLFDYDGDGDLDVYLVQGALLEETKRLEEALFPPPPNDRPPRNRLFRNQLVETGKLYFKDVTEEAGVGDEGFGMGVAVGDYDNDGHLDLYVTNFGPNVLYRNNGDGTFADVTKIAGVDDPRWNASACFVDYNLDGHLDLFVTAYVDFTVGVDKKCYDKTGAQDYCSPTVYNPLPDWLFRNEGNGKFLDVSEEAGITAGFGNGLGVAPGDFNGDGWPDLYVANDQTPNELWINQGDGTFKPMGLLSGTAYNAGSVAEAGMGIAVADIDGDGDEDIFVTNLATETNTLYLNDGRGNFQDVTLQFQLAGVSLPFTGFGTNWFDFDNDGDLDLFVANGAVTIEETRLGEPYPYRQRNQLFRNEGENQFKQIRSIAGPALDLAEVSRGAAVGGLDNDGRLDLLVSNNNGPVRLFLNQTETRFPWLQVSLQAEQKNRHGIGAGIALVDTDGKRTWRWVRTTGSYLTSTPARVHFGLGADGAIRGLLVRWPDGTREFWPKRHVNKHLRLERGSGNSA